MQRQRFGWLLVTVLGFATAGQSAWAQAGGAKQNEQFAMENFDLGDFVAAKDSLTAAITEAEAAGKGNTPEAAQLHMLLGMVLVQGQNDLPGAHAQFVKAIELNPDVTLDARGNDQAKAAFKKAQDMVNPVVDCQTLQGLAHKRVAVGKQNQPIEIAVSVGQAVKAADLVLRYRNSTMAEFAEMPMKDKAGCERSAVLDKEIVQPTTILYYIEAKTKAGKLAAAQGSDSRPFRIAIERLVVAAETKAELKKQEDEIPDALKVNQGGPAKGGCAGCESGNSSGWLIALVMLLALRGKRAIGALRGQTQTPLGQ